MYSFKKLKQGRKVWGTGLLFCAALLWASACQNSKESTLTTSPEKVISPEAALSVPARPKVLRFGLTPYLPKEQMRKQFEPLAEYLSKELNIRIKLVFSNSYANLTKLLKNKKIELAVLSPLAYVEAKKINEDLQPLVTHIADGSSTYVGYIVAPIGTKAEHVRDLKGAKFAFVDQQSASGFLYPKAYMIREGIKAEEHFKKIRFAGNHTKVLKWIESGYVDAGATYSTALKLAAGDADAGLGFKVLAKTGRIPYDAYCASSAVSDSLALEIKEIFKNLSTRTKIGRQVLGGVIAINGFVEVDDAHYDEVREVARLMDSQLPNSVDSGIHKP